MVKLKKLTDIPNRSFQPPANSLSLIDSEAKEDKAYDLEEGLNEDARLVWASGNI